MEVISPFKGYQIIRPSETPDGEKWALAEMEKTGNDLVLRTWQVGFDGEKILVFRTTPNTETIDEKEVITNTSGRNLQEQALLNGKSLYKDKFYEGYIPIGSNLIPKKTPMKGCAFEPGVMRHSKVWLISPKLDGMRLVCTHKGGSKIETRSYMNRLYTTFGHIEEQLLVLIMYMGSYVMFDGEMYNHNVIFDDIISATRTVKNKHTNLKKMNYCIFDFFSEETLTAEERYDTLKKAVSQAKADGHKLPNIKVVPQTAVTDEKTMQRYTDKYISKGYEGAVIKRAAGDAKPGSDQWKMSLYHFGKSTRMYKVKRFFDEEMEVVDVQHGKGKDRYLALLIVKDQYDVRTRIRFGKDEDRRQWLEDPSMVIGRMITVKFVERTKDMKLRIPSGKAFRDYE